MKKVNIALAITLIMATCAVATATERSLVRRIKDLSHDNAKAGSFRALVIGIDGYDDPAIPDLSTAAHDARAVAEVLSKQYGFVVQTLLNQQATRRGIYGSLRKLAAHSGPDDNLLIYFAGHGDIDRQFGGEDGWWIPVDATGGDPLTYLDNVQVQKAMRHTKARHVLLISDSCYSGTLFGISTRAIPPVITDRYYLELFNEKSRWGMTSGNKTPVSDEGSQSHSVFAYQLLKALCKNKRPYLSTQELYTKIAPIIANNSEQTPMCRPIRNTGDQGGEMVFIRTGQNPSDLSACRIFPLFADSGGAQVITPPTEPAPARPGRLTVKSSVVGASVAINGQTFDGPLPKTFSIKQKGRYEVRVTADGCEPYQNIVEMGPGETRDLTAHLEKIDTGPVEPVAPVQPADGQPKPGEIWTEPSTGMEFVWVPGGCFQMGQTEVGKWQVIQKKGRKEYERYYYQDELPIHRVCVDGFWMGRTEVTNGQYRRFKSGHDSGDYKGNSLNGEDQPVVEVSWKDAVAYADWLSDQTGAEIRLPSEAEWEYACRAGSKTVRFWGDDSNNACRYANVADQTAKRKWSDWAIHDCDDGYAVTAPVGRFQANDFGLKDMLGNVWEWCLDIYDYDAYKQHVQDNPIYTAGAFDIIADKSTYRVTRSGSWGADPGGVRCADRDGASPGGEFEFLGFRLLRTH